MLMKRKALALILIIVIALSIATWLVYNKISELESQNSELQEQLRELQEQIESVKITEFEWESGFNYLGALTLVNIAYFPFHVHTKQSTTTPQT